MHRDKIEASLSTALRDIDDSTRTMSSSNDKKVLSDSLWPALAEIEYTVFLFSIIQGEKSENASWKHASSSKQPVELEHALTSARELIESAKVKIEQDDFEKAYEETWTARNLLLKAHDVLEKIEGSHEIEIAYSAPPAIFRSFIIKMFSSLPAITRNSFFKSALYRYFLRSTRKCSFFGASPFSPSFNVISVSAAFIVVFTLSFKNFLSSSTSFLCALRSFETSTTKLDNVFHLLDFIF
jgi:hypothetical protein